MQDLLITGGMIFATVYGAGKWAMNGLAKSQARIEKKIDKMDDRLDVHGERLATLEERRRVPRD